MIAVKGNTEYTISDSEKKAYIAQGFDIYNDEGKKIEDGQHKNVPFLKYKELETKYNALQAEKSDISKLKKENEDLAKANKELETKVAELEKKLK